MAGLKGKNEMFLTTSGRISVVKGFVMERERRMRIKLKAMKAFGDWCGEETESREIEHIRHPDPDNALHIQGEGRVQISYCRPVSLPWSPLAAQPGCFRVIRTIVGGA